MTSYAPARSRPCGSRAPRASCSPVAYLLSLREVRRGLLVGAVLVSVALVLPRLLGAGS